MKISFNPQQLFDSTGVPLAAGRVSLYVHDSDVLMHVYRLSGEIYSDAQNPIVLDDEGRMDTVWFDAAIVDVKVEKNVDGTYAPVDTYQYGFALPDTVNDTVLYGIDALADADPGTGTVTVVGYRTPGDCGPRTYAWDPTCTDAEDGGCIVASRHADEGRWLLVSDGKYLPSSWYGIEAGEDEANIGAFLSYQERVGQWQVGMPPVPLFEAGTYGITGGMATAKTVAFGAGAKFTALTLQCRSAEVVPGTDYTCDMTFTDQGCSARSSWFRTVEKFWTCGATVLHLDPVNYFVDSTVSHRLTVPDKVILGTQRLDVNYANDGYVYLTRCSVSGRIFNPQKDYVRLSSSDRGDSVFTDAGTWGPGLISQGHHVQYDDVPDLAQFRSVERWYQAINERKVRLGQQMSMTALDFDGRACPVNIDTSVWGAVKNVQADGGISVKNSVLLDNVKGDIDVNAEIAAGVTLQDCNVRITGTPVNFSSLTAIDSTVTVAGSVGLDPADTMVTVYGGHFNGIIQLSAAHAQSFAASKSVDFRNVSFETAFTWKVNRLNMQGCTGPVSIDLYPVSTAGNYLYSVNLDKNVFTGSSRVWFGLPRGLVSYSGLDGKAAFGSVRIVDNSFETSDPLGIKMLRWNPGTLNRLVAQEPGAWEYHGNGGNCPRLSPGAVYNGDGNWSQYAQGGTQWCKYAGTMNVFAPYAWYSDGSINWARDNTGLSPDRSSGQMCMLCTTANAAPLVLLCGYCAGQSLPSDGWDEDANDLFVLIPAITNGTGTMPAPATGFTYWYQQGLV